jgi:hypothetical protein
MANPFITSAPANQTPDAADIQRQQALAQMLMQQSMQQPGTQTIGGVAIRQSPLEGISRLAQAYMARKGMDRAGQMQRQMQQAGVSDVGRFVDAIKGAPASEGNNPSGYQPGKSPDLGEAMRIALGSQNPTLSQAGGSLLGGVIAQQTKAPKWEKVDLPNPDGTARTGFVDVNSPNPISTFQEGGKSGVKSEFVNGTAVNPFQTKPGTVIPKESNPYQDLVVPGPEGQVLPNAPVIQAKKEIANAGKTSVSVSVDKGFGEAFAKNAAEALATSRDSAKAASTTLQTLSRMDQALKNGALVGPGSNWRTLGLQIGQTLGVTGKSADETLANTRKLIQGAAQVSLEGASTMKGQGQVSNYERDLVERASGGGVDKMTTPEIKALIGVLTKVNTQRIQQHSQNLQQVPEDFKKYAPMYQVPMPETNAVRRFNPTTGMIE